MHAQLPILFWKHKNSNAVNAKSMLCLLAEGMGQGTKVEITANGSDEQQAVESLVKLIDTSFGE